MDRKTCVLFYSSNSKASTDLFNYIQNLPINFPALAGLTFVSVDSWPVRQVLLNNNITTVPVLLVEYFSTPNSLPKKQQLVGELIYKWVDEIVLSAGQRPPSVSSIPLDTSAEDCTGLWPANAEGRKQPNSTTTQKKVSFIQQPTPPTQHDFQLPEASSRYDLQSPQSYDRTTNNAVEEPDPSAGYKLPSRNKDIAAVAAEMAKFREQEDEKINRRRKEGFPHNTTI